MDRREAIAQTAWATMWTTMGLPMTCEQFVGASEKIKATYRVLADAILALPQGEAVAWRESDLGWVRGLVQRQAYSGHCGEENAEIRARRDNDDRIERVLACLASPSPPAPDRVNVPREPTEAMIDAAHAQDAAMREQGFNGAPVEGVWSAMIDAALLATGGE